MCTTNLLTCEYLYSALGALDSIDQCNSGGILSNHSLDPASLKLVVERGAGRGRGERREDYKVCVSKLCLQWGGGLAGGRKRGEEKRERTTKSV